MTMTDTPEVQKPKRKYGKRVRAKVEKQKPASEFAGMTDKECCADCSEKKCVISGIGHCIHPNKGGLPASMQMNREVTARYARAKKELSHLLVDRRHGK